MAITTLQHPTAMQDHVYNTPYYISALPTITRSLQ